MTRQLVRSLGLAALATLVFSAPLRAIPFTAWNQDSNTGFDMVFSGTLTPSWTIDLATFTSPTGLWSFTYRGAEVFQTSPVDFGVAVHSVQGNYLGADPFPFKTDGGYGTSATVGSSSGNFLRNIDGLPFAGEVITSFPTGESSSPATWAYNVHVTFGSTLAPSPVPDGGATVALLGVAFLGMLGLRKVIRGNGTIGSQGNETPLPQLPR